MIVEVRVLRQIADAALGVDVAGGAAEQLGAAAGRKHQLHQQLQRRGLAGAVRTEEAEDFTRLHVEGEVIERAIRAVFARSRLRSPLSARVSRARP